MQTSTTTFTRKVKALLILSSWHTARPVFTSSALHWLCQAVNLSWLFAIQFHKSSLIIRQIMLVGHFPISEEQTPSSDVYDSAALAIFKEWGIDPEGPAENDCINPIFRCLPKYLLFSHFLTAETIWAEFYMLETSGLQKIQRFSPGAPGVLFNELSFLRDLADWAFALWWTVPQTCGTCTRKSSATSDSQSGSGGSIVEKMKIFCKLSSPPSFRWTDPQLKTVCYNSPFENIFHSLLLDTSLLARVFWFTAWRALTGFRLLSFSSSRYKFL